MAINILNEAIESGENSKNNRLTYIDVAKGIGISMIVWAHAHCPAGIYFITFAVPLFFLISGFLYKEEQSLKEYIKRKTVTLYLPFVLCNLLWPTFILCCRAFAGHPITNNLLNIFLIILTLKKDGFLFGATWFLSSLFLTCVSYKFIDVFMKKWKYKTYFITAFYLFLAYAASQLMPYLNHDVRRTLILPLFFAIGALIKSNAGYLRTINNLFTLITVCSFFVLLEVYLTKIGMVEYSYGANSLYNLVTFILATLLSTYMIIYISRIVSNDINNKMCILFSYLGRNSLHILLWHFVFFEILTALILRASNISLSLLDRFPHVVAAGIWVVAYFLIGICGPILMVNGFKACKRFFLKQGKLTTAISN